MSEKQEAEDFDEADDDEVVDDSDDIDMARLTKDMDIVRRRGPKHGVPALRRLEQLAEQKRTKELTSDFDDYDIDEPRRSHRRSTG
jgi:hypothetical protein